jgi:hypothetical protein
MKKLLSINGVVFPVCEAQAVSCIIDDYVHGPDTYRKVFKIILKGGLEVLWTGAYFQGADDMQSMVCHEAANIARQQIVDALWPGALLVMVV